MTEEEKFELSVNQVVLDVLNSSPKSILPSEIVKSLDYWARTLDSKEAWLSILSLENSSQASIGREMRLSGSRVGQMLSRIRRKSMHPRVRNELSWFWKTPSIPGESLSSLRDALAFAGQYCPEVLGILEGHCKCEKVDSSVWKTPGEVSEILNVQKRVVSSYVSRGIIPSRKISGRNWVHVSFLKGRTRESFYRDTNLSGLCKWAQDEGLRIIKMYDLWETVFKPNSKSPGLYLRWESHWREQEKGDAYLRLVQLHKESPPEFHIWARRSVHSGGYRASFPADGSGKVIIKSIADNPLNAFSLVFREVGDH